MESILVSSCLLGERVRYNAGDKRCNDPILQRWLQAGRVVSVCPEVAGGCLCRARRLRSPPVRMEWKS